MITMTLPLFLLACIRGMMRPGFALALVASMFAIKQLMQSSIPWLATSSVGSVAINFAVLGVSLVALLLRLVRHENRRADRFNPTWISAVALYAWSAVTCIWTPSTTAMEWVGIGLPYFALLILIAPLLVTSWDDAYRFHQALLWIGIPAAMLILVSPDFTTKYGRLGLEIGGGRTNPLALGEFGGLLFIAGALWRKPGTVTLLFRVVALLVGAALAIRSGSRGQFLYAVVIGIAFFPLAAPVRNIRVFLLTAAGVLVLGFLATQLVELLLDNPLESKRFTIEEMFFGRSSASGRFANVMVLFDAWISHPLAPILGLGYSAFEYYSGVVGEPYSHVIFADAIFELGLPGAVLMGIFIVTSTRSAIGLFKSSSDDLDRRSSAAMIIAWFAYETLLANKQGAFWVMPMMFPAGIVLSQLALHEVRPSSAEEASPEPTSSGSLSPAGQH